MGHAWPHHHSLIRSAHRCVCGRRLVVVKAVGESSSANRLMAMTLGIPMMPVPSDYDQTPSAYPITSPTPRKLPHTNNTDTSAVDLGSAAPPREISGQDCLDFSQKPRKFVPIEAPQDVLFLHELPDDRSRQRVIARPSLLPFDKLRVALRMTHSTSSGSRSG